MSGSKLDDFRGESSELIVVGDTDGDVRIMQGPTERHCGSFASLSEDTALDVFELLGYKASQVCTGTTPSTGSPWSSIPQRHATSATTTLLSEEHFCRRVLVSADCNSVV